MAKRHSHWAPRIQKELLRRDAQIKLYNDVNSCCYHDFILKQATEHGFEILKRKIDGREMFSMRVKNLPDNIEKIKQLNFKVAEVGGWDIFIFNKFGAITNIESEINDDFLWIEYRMRFEKSKMNPLYLYHLTPIENFNKIKKCGIEPKAKRTSFRQALKSYFCDSCIETIKLASLFVNYRYKKNEENIIVEFYILRTTTPDYRKYHCNSYPRYYVCSPEFIADPNYKNGFITLENVDIYKKPYGRIVLNCEGDVVYSDEP